MAVAEYQDQHGHYPPAWLADENGKPLLSWRVLILPYIDQQELYEQFKLDEPWDSPNNIKLLDQMSSVFRLHSREGDRHGKIEPYTDYVAVVGEETVWQGPTPRELNFVTDGTDNTLLIAEFVGHRIPWTKPEDLLFSEMSMQVDSAEGICSILSPPAFVTASGRVQYLPTDTSDADVRALLTAAGGEPARTLPRTNDGRLRPRKTGT